MTLTNVTVQNNQALGASYLGGAAYGGGICVYQGQLTLINSTVANNQALGGSGAGSGPLVYGGVPQGGNAYGGGLYFNGSKLTISSSSITDNTAQGGAGGNALAGASTYSATQASSSSSQPAGSPGASTSGPGGFASGGGVCAGAFTAFTLTTSTLDDNLARGGAGGPGPVWMLLFPSSPLPGLSRPEAAARLRPAASSQGTAEWAAGEWAVGSPPTVRLLVL